MKGGTRRSAILSNGGTLTNRTIGDPATVWSLFLYGAFLYVGSLLWTGCGLYWSNHALQLPLVFQWNDPSLYPGDPFVATLQYYAAPLWKAVALLNRIFPIEPLLIALFLFERLLLMIAAARLALAFAPGSKLAATAAMTLIALAPSPILGNGTIVTDYFEHTGLSIAFCLLAVASFFRSRPYRTAFWLAIAFHLNSLYGCYATTYLLAAGITDKQLWDNGKKWIYASLFFLLLISPILIPTIGALRQTSSSTELWLQIARLRFPHHLFPMTWSGSHFLIFGMVFFGVSWIATRASDRRLRRFVFAWSLVCLLWLIVAFGAAYIVRRPVLLVAHPARGADLWYAIAGIAAIVTAARKVESWKRSEAVGIVLTMIVCAAGLYSLMTRPGFLKFPEKDLRDAAIWAEASTPLSSTFLVNPLNGEFRALSRRPLFSSWKDGSAILWDRPFVSIWSERLEAIGFDVSRVLRSRVEAETAVENAYLSLTDERLGDLSGRYNIAYAVMPSAYKSRYAAVYRNPSLQILFLKMKSVK